MANYVHSQISEDNIQMDPKESGTGDVELIYFVQPKVQWRGFVTVS